MIKDQDLQAGTTADDVIPEVMYRFFPGGKGLVVDGVNPVL